MKRLLVFAGILVSFILSVSYVNAQAISERKIQKDAKKQAKLFVKEGWKVAPGHPSIELQQLRASKMSNAFDEDFKPQFIYGNAQSLGQNYDAAKFQATELAKINIASRVAGEIVGIAQSNIGNTQLDPGQAASMAKSIGEFKDLIATKLTGIISVIDMYKTEPNGNTTVSVGLFYNRNDAVRAGIQAVREEMMKESQDLGKEIDALLGIKH